MTKPRRMSFGISGITLLFCATSAGCSSSSEPTQSTPGIDCKLSPSAPACVDAGDNDATPPDAAPADSAAKDSGSGGDTGSGGDSKATEVSGDGSTDAGAG
ncbi:MAG: hypothetical protein NVS3B20_01340 [Polyangiales bacterium]